MRNYILFCILALTVLVLPASGNVAIHESIRVAVLKNVDSVNLDGEGVLAVDESGKPVISDGLLTASVSSGKLLINGTSYSKIRAASPDVLKLNSKRYRGVLELVPAGGTITVINELPLEDYLVGLINCEISSAWHIESVKAQAVIARTYALYQKKTRAGQLYHLEATVQDQVYGGSDNEDSRALQAVQDTRGEYLAYNREVIQAFYHSSCGGRTETSENVWGFALPYIKSVSCRYCLETKKHDWEYSVSLKKLESVFNLDKLKDVRISESTESGRAKTLDLITSKGFTKVSGVKFRQALGYGTVKSTRFELKLDDDAVFINGTGSGHGVGLCQWGSKKRAEEGFSYREILEYYYPSTSVMKLGAD